MNAAGNALRLKAEVSANIFKRAESTPNNLCHIANSKPSSSEIIMIIIFQQLIYSFAALASLNLSRWGEICLVDKMLLR